ncbi:hypothetical protein KNT81_gp098 [Proteus phage phiP4-3]|uniref:Uncharacterized protein n=1 Tax=Proteus phage phiP4-3 TaxID=2065203 RepID=A0A2I6PFE7_9CAUD|nr:hypothetical protein KNT81_gp098 [Proteus phage phiP4-3]AUM58456.1 hypothetical protein phiP43_098 [Proteus phage phiP4-3]AZV01299.1 hypothetical protein vBSdyM006_162 [Shigella phage vB_SdyM_006]
MFIDKLKDSKDSLVELESKQVFNDIAKRLMLKSKHGYDSLTWTLGEISYRVQEKVITKLQNEGLTVKRTQFDSNIIQITGW